MKKWIIFAAMLCAVPALADEAKKDEPHKLTVGELINIGNALVSIDMHPVPQPNGQIVSMPAGFKFTGIARMTFATIVDAARTQQRLFQEATTAIQPKPEKQEDGKEIIPKEKQEAFEAERQKMFDAPVQHFQVPRIPYSMLCLDAKPPECPIQNDIPVNTISILWPLIDQGK